MEHLLKYRLSPNSLPNMICNPFQSLIQPEIKRKNYAFIKLIKMPAALINVLTVITALNFMKKIWCPFKQHDNDLLENVFFLIIVFNKAVL